MGYVALVYVEITLLHSLHIRLATTEWSDVSSALPRRCGILVPIKDRHDSRWPIECIAPHHTLI
jgi:hypothetical protein